MFTIKICTCALWSHRGLKTSEIPKTGSTLGIRHYMYVTEVAYLETRKGSQP